MRRSFALVPVLGLALAGLAAAETTRTLRVQLSGDPARPFAVENLAGTMHITATDEPTVTAVATLHAESDSLAGSVCFEQVVNENGIPTLRVRYPVDRHQDYRYPGSGSGGFWDGLFGGSRIKYDGALVSVNGSRGVLLYADVEVKVPRRTLDAVFKNHVGALSAEGIEGRVRLDAGSGAISAERMKGEVTADTGSGSIEIEARGTRFRQIKADTGSGSVKLRLPVDAGFELRADTGSGDIVSRFPDAQAIVHRKEVVGYRRGDGRVRIDVDTGSGDVLVEPAR